MSLCLDQTLSYCVVSSVLYKVKQPYCTQSCKPPFPLLSPSSAMQSLQWSSPCPQFEFHSVLWLFHQQCLLCSYLATSVSLLQLPGLCGHTELVPMPCRCPCLPGVHALLVRMPHRCPCLAGALLVAALLVLMPHQCTCLGSAWWLFSLHLLLLFCPIHHTEAGAIFPKYSNFIAYSKPPCLSPLERSLSHSLPPLHGQSGLLLHPWPLSSVLGVCGKLC
jgi:hypothetical protein